MPTIHPTATVDPRAQIADDVEIGPYCVVGAGVVLGSGCVLIAQVHLAGRTTIGEATKIAPFASLGTPPQSVKYRGGDTCLTIGAACDIREGVTMNTGTEDGGGITRVGSRCLFMVGSHVAHDCQVGDDVAFANNAVLGGHVVVGDHTFLGGQAAVHQFVRLGESAMISGVTGVAADVIPFGLARGSYAALEGLNVVGMRRRGLTHSDMLRLRRLYRVLFFGGGVFRDRIANIVAEFGDDPLASKIIAFVREGNSRRLMLPSAGSESSSDPPS
jgi:UDP-N-acetylglucosamine acyltransferase